MEHKALTLGQETSLNGAKDHELFEFPKSDGG